MLARLEDTRSLRRALAGHQHSGPSNRTPALQATERIGAARAALAHAIEVGCARLAHKARRAGCTLADTRPEDITAEDVARHLVACDACVKSLDAVSAQREALVVLGSPRDPGASRVAALVAEAQGKGREALARFLAELARACLLQIPEVRVRSESILEPDEQKVLRLGAANLARRAETPIEVLDLDQAGRWVAIANAAVESLVRVEGETARTHYYRACVATARGDWQGARPLLERSIRLAGKTPYRETATHLLATTLGELMDHHAAIELCNRMIQENLAPRAAWYGLWRAHGLLGHAVDCEVAAAGFHRSPLQPSSRGAWANQVRTTAEDVAAAIGLPVADVLQAMGYAELGGGA